MPGWKTLSVLWDAKYFVHRINFLYLASLYFTISKFKVSQGIYWTDFSFDPQNHRITSLLSRNFFCQGSGKIKDYTKLVFFQIVCIHLELFSGRSTLFQRRKQKHILKIIFHVFWRPEDSPSLQVHPYSRFIFHRQWNSRQVKGIK